MWALGEMNIDYQHIPTDHRADGLNVASSLVFALLMPFSFDGHKNVKRWLDDVRSRAVQKKIGDEMLARAKAVSAAQ